MAANVTQVNAVAGTVVAAGLAIQVTAATRLEDQRDGVRPFGLADLAVGDFIEARGTPGTSATLAATLLEREGASATGRLRGPAGAIALPSFSVLGVPMVTGGGTGYRDDDGNVIDQATFFAALAPGSEVHVSFTQGTSPLAVIEAQLEDDDDDGIDDD